MQHIYVDASIQSKGMNEHKALVSMIEKGYKTFNNIAHFQEKNWNYIIRSKKSYGIKYENPDSDEFDKEDTITFTRRKTKDTMTLYFKDKISEESLLEMVQKFMSPIRPGRVFERYKNIKNAVGFAYRIY